MNRTEDEDVAADRTWSLPVAWVVFTVLVLGVLASGGVSFLVQAPGGHDGPPPLFMVFWFAALGWNVYGWLFLIAYRVDLVGSTLHWRAPLRRGTMPISAITGARRFLGAPFTCVLRAPGHRSIIVFTQLRSFTPMLIAINRLNPAVPPGL